MDSFEEFPEFFNSRLRDAFRAEQSQLRHRVKGVKVWMEEEDETADEVLMLVVVIIESVVMSDNAENCGHGRTEPSSLAYRITGSGRF